MTNNPVDVKRTPANRPAGLPDTWRMFRNDMNRLFDRFGFGLDWPSFGSTVDVSFPAPFTGNGPVADLNEDDKSYTLTAELPGMDEKEIELTISGRQLTLKGQKTQDKEEKQKNCYFSERSYGAFQRSFYLPEGIDQDKVVANFDKGVLKVTLPKTIEVQKQQKKIEIKAA